MKNSHFSNVFAALLLTAIAATAAPTLGHKEFTPDELRAAEDYWTPERRAAAIPMNFATPAWAQNDAAELSAMPEPLRAVPGAEPEAENSAAADEAAFWTAEQKDTAIEDLSLSEGIDPLAYPYPFTRFSVAAHKNKFPHKAVGKLFVTIGGANYVCTATVIRPHLLLTARHCIYDYAKKVWATAAVFFPGYNNGPNTTLGPSNGWGARIATTFTTNSPGVAFDLGTIQTFNRNRTACAPKGANRQVESYTGYLGYKYGGSYLNRTFDVLAYPHFAPFNGATQQQCNSKTGALNPGGNKSSVETGCDFNGGADGGPWLEKYKLSSTAATNNYVTSLVSNKLSGHPLAVIGPQFTSKNIKVLIDYASGLPCPGEDDCVIVCATSAQP